MNRIGIFSGTFDPVHDGHILFAQTVLAEFGLDQIYFAPEPKPRFKEFASDSTYRAAMIEQAISEYDGFRLFLSSSDQHGIDLLNEIEEEIGPTKFYMLVGSDVVDFLADWQDIDALSQRVKFVVANRTEDDSVVDEKARLAQIEYEIMPSPLRSVSSSRIRQAIADRTPPKGLNDTVKNFIDKHQLYG